MTGEKDLDKVLKTLKPKLNPGDYVFCTIQDLSEVNLSEVVSIFKEHEGITIVIEKQIADRLKFDYSFIASWITLTAHSSLQAVGLTAIF